MGVKQSYLNRMLILSSGWISLQLYEHFILHISQLYLLPELITAFEIKRFNFDTITQNIKIKPNLYAHLTKKKKETYENKLMFPYSSAIHTESKQILPVNKVKLTVLDKFDHSFWLVVRIARIT